MTTTTAPAEPTVPDERTTSDSAPPAPPDGHPSRSVWRLRLAAVCVGLVLLALAQDAGGIAADTKLDLVVDPARLLGRSLHLWDPLGAFGQLQNQGYGYLFPMGPFFLVGDWLALPPWVVQRLWHAVLLVVGFLGVVRLGGRLTVGSPWTRVVAGLAYVLAPRVLSELGSISSEVLPVAVAPWVLLPLVGHAALAFPRRAAARSGVALLFAGGVNAAATVAILPLAAWWLLTRPAGAARRRLAGWWVAAVAAACAWWALPLLVLGRFSPPFLDWIESASVTTSVTDLLDVLRGTSHWVTRVSGAGGPEWPAGFVLTTEPAAVLATGTFALLGLLGLCSPRVPHRGFLVGALLLGVALVTAGHVGPGDGAGSGWIRELLDGALAAFRNVHKFDPVLRLPMVLGVAHLLTVGRPLRLRRVTLPTATKAFVPAVAVALLAVIAAPALAGRLVPSPRSVTDAAYWREAAAWLSARPETGRALVVPGAPFATYVWGRTSDDVMQPLASSPWAVRDAVPLSSAGNIRLLDAIGARLDAGRGSPGLAAALARSGVGAVVVRNDLDPLRAGSTPPDLVHEALSSSPGLSQVASFGPDLRQPSGTAYPAVEVYLVGLEPAAAVTRLPVAGALRTTGGPEDVLTLADRGLLDGRALLLAGDDAGDAAAVATPVVSDTYRRREVGFSAVRAGTSASLTSDEAYRLDRPVHDYLPGGLGPPSAARLHGGLSAVTASSSGSDVDALLARGPDHQPFAALDGDPSTSWVSGSFTGAVGQWLDMRFTSPVSLSAVELAFTAEQFVGPLPTRLVLETDAGRREETVSPDPLVQRVATASGATARLRITVAAVEGGGSGFATGLATLVVPQLFPTRTLVVPPPTSSEPPLVAFGVADGAHQSCVGTGGVPACAPSAERAGEEDVVLDRSFSTDGTDDLRLALTVRPRPGAALDALLAPPGGSLRATATTRLGTDPRVGPGASVDGDPDTGWVAAPGQQAPVLRVRWKGARPVHGLRLAPLRAGPVGAADRVTVSARVGPRGTGTRRAAADSRGVVRFEPVIGDELVVRIDQTRARADGAANPGPVAVAEVSVFGPGGSASAGVAGADQILLPCGRGPVVEVDGRRIETAVTGTRRAWASGRSLPARPCGVAEVRLPAGEHRLRVAATDATRPQELTMVPVGGLPDPGPTGPPARIGRWDATSRTVAVDPAAAATYLVVRENANAGWRATLDGSVLRPVRLDGWQQGWLVPAGVGGAVELFYTPDAAYRTGLLLGALAAVAMVALALFPGRWSSSAHRRAGGGHRTVGWAALPAPGAALAERRVEEHAPRRRGRWVGRWLPLAVVTVAVVLSTGWILPAVALPAAGLIVVLDRRRPLAARWIPASLVLAGGGVAVVLGTVGPAGEPQPLAGGLVAQVGCLVALAGVAAPALLDALRPAERTRPSSGRSTTR